MNRVRLSVASLATLVLPAVLGAAVSLPRIFGDHMVLQAGRSVPVWGRAAPGAEIIVRLADRRRRTRAGADGRWEIELGPMKASAAPRELTVTGDGEIRLRDVLVGEVWLCSGQSNMEYAVGIAKPWAPPASASDPQLAEELKTTPRPAIRLFLVAKKRGARDVVSTGWHEAAGAPRNRFSAVAYYFGRRLQQTLHVPVGLIDSCWGGSRIEEWTPPNAYAELRTVFTGKAAQSFERDRAWIGRDCESMIRPLAPFGLSGVIWYQGESNLIAYNDGMRYADKMRVMIDAWRVAWRRPDLPFYYVQIAPFRYSQLHDRLAHAPDELPKLWEAQAAALQIPHTGMVPTTDLVDDVTKIHPDHKLVVGDRLAALALAGTYGRSAGEWRGPSFDRLEVHGADAVVHFRHGDGGLASRGGKPLTDFEIAGADGRFFPAQAVIRGDTVVVTSPHVSRPAAVRFGWNEADRPNLVDRGGLPAYPFRSDGPVWRPAP